MPKRPFLNRFAWSWTVGCAHLGTRGCYATEAESGGRVDLVYLFRYLADQEINEVLLEAGPTLAGAALQAGLVDELTLYLAPHLMGDRGRGLFGLPGLERMRDRIDLALTDTRMIGPDLRITAVPRAHSGALGPEPRSAQGGLGTGESQ